MHGERTFEVRPLSLSKAYMERAYQHWYGVAHKSTVVRALESMQHRNLRVDIGCGLWAVFATYILEKRHWLGRSDNVVRPIFIDRT